MITRRKALATIGATGLFGPCHIEAGAAAAQESADGELSKDLARLGARVYSEEGIPMLLVCENLAPDHAPGSQKPAAARLTESNRIVASAFHRYAGEWERIKLDAPAG